MLPVDEAEADREIGVLHSQQGPAAGPLPGNRVGAQRKATTIS
ncbi:hypothetical protein [Lichenifustis flavocetrariae]|nr:hypothetical protein [Lichenifustis flavocetrariae]